ncbi:hypothetical protein BSG1_14874 [Bacillus sp. SG-1]|nr:hypothetical protein BSG1_14874 [Bacillus sp. SG-1]
MKTTYASERNLDNRILHILYKGVERMKKIDTFRSKSGKYNVVIFETRRPSAAAIENTNRKVNEAMNKRMNA